VTHDVRPVRREYRRASGTASGIASLAHGEMKWPNPNIGGHFGALLRGSGCGWLGFTEKCEPGPFDSLENINARAAGVGRGFLTLMRRY
jgi:hypothetical protein